MLNIRSRQYHGSARVDEFSNGDIRLTSYETEVVRLNIFSKQVIYAPEAHCSNTTRHHVSCFYSEYLNGNNYEDISAAQKYTFSDDGIDDVIEYLMSSDCHKYYTCFNDFLVDYLNVKSSIKPYYIAKNLAALKEKLKDIDKSKISVHEAYEHRIGICVPWKNGSIYVERPDIDVLAKKLHILNENGNELANAFKYGSDRIKKQQELMLKLIKRYKGLGVTCKRNGLVVYKDIAHKRQSIAGVFFSVETSSDKINEACKSLQVD